MNLYDKAYEFARALRESSELKELKELRSQINADADSKRMLDDFQNRQQELQQKIMSGEMPPKEEMEKMEKLYEVMSLNPLLSRLFAAEQRLGLIMQDIQKIITEPINEVL